MHLGGLCLHHLGVSHLLCIYMWHPMSWQHLDLVRICHVAEASRVLRPMSWHRILCRIIAVKMLRPVSWHCSAATCLCNRTSSSGHSFQKLTIQRISTTHTNGMAPSPGSPCMNTYVYTLVSVVILARAIAACHRGNFTMPMECPQCRQDRSCRD